MKCLVCEQKEFVLYTVLYRKPVKLNEDGSDMVNFFHKIDQSRSSILYTLESVYLILRKIVEQAVQVVQF